MRQRRLLILCLCGLLCLTGCGAPPPVTAADGAAWDEDWVSVGNVVGVETPEGMTLRENSDVLSTRGMYYAFWSIGEGETVVNEDGEEAQVYDVQVYLLLAGCGGTAQAEDTAAEWRDMASQRYAVETETAETYNGQECTVLTYAYTSETNPCARGASAFGTYGNYALSVEAACREGADADALEILADFMEHCHYAA